MRKLEKKLQSIFHSANDSIVASIREAQLTSRADRRKIYLLYLGTILFDFHLVRLGLVNVVLNVVPAKITCGLLFYYEIQLQLEKDEISCLLSGKMA